MKKILISLITAVASIGMIAYGAPSTVASYAAPNLVSEINAALANTTNTTLSVDGKSTLNGELEVNGSDVDINMTLTGNEIDITQTNAAGTANVPLVKITDARTGATADTAGEAALVIDAEGAYGLSVVDGILNIESEIDSTGDILLDPAGNEVHIDGGLHVGGTDAVGDNNLKVDGTLDVTGVATFDATPVCQDGLTVGTNLTLSALTVSKPVFTDGSRVLVSKTIVNDDVALTSSVTPQVVTPTATPTLQTGAVTASGANNLVTPTATLTPETGAVTAEGANNLVTPTATITPHVVTPTATPTLQTGAVTASGANNLVTPTITVTIYTTTGYDSTGAAITNNAGATVAMMTNATATCSPDLASNAVVVINVTGGDAVVTNLTIAVTPDLMTNATCAITPDLASNATVAVTVTGGGAVWTNATCAITPDLASNAVTAVTVTGGDAVVTNLTIAVTPDLMTNAVVTTP